MNLKHINVLLIEDSPDYAELVEQWLSSAAAEDGFALRWADTLAQGKNALNAGGVDVVLLDLGLPDSDGWPTFDALRVHAHGIPVIVLSSTDSESLALRTIQEGAEDYLVKSTCTRDLLVRSVRYAMVRRRSQSASGAGGPSGRHRVLGVVGSKGGVGTTTVACHLADELQRQTGQRVLLADLDVQAGYASFLMGVDPQYSLHDAVSSIETLDASCWQSIVTEKRTDLHVLTSPAFAGNAQIDPARIRSLLRLVAPSYGWCVLDLGTLNPVSRAVLEEVDGVLLVGSPAIPSLYGAKRAIDALVNSGMDRDAFRLILNRTDESQAFSEAQLNRMFGVPVCAIIPAAGVELHQAYLERDLLSGASKARKEFSRLARQIAGIPEPAPKRTLSSLLSFVGSTKNKDQERTPAGV